MEHTESEILCETLNEIIWDFISANDGRMRVADVLYTFEVIKKDLMTDEEDDEG